MSQNRIQRAAKQHYEQAFGLSAIAAASVATDPYLQSKLSAMAFAGSDERTDIRHRPVLRGFPIDKSQRIKNISMLVSPDDYVDGDCFLRRFPDAGQIGASKTTVSLFRFKEVSTTAMLAAAQAYELVGISRALVENTVHDNLSVLQVYWFFRGWGKGIDGSQSLHNEDGMQAREFFRRDLGLDKAGTTLISLVSVNVGNVNATRIVPMFMKVHVVSSSSAEFTFHALDSQVGWGENTLMLLADLKP